MDEVVPRFKPPDREQLMPTQGWVRSVVVAGRKVGNVHDCAAESPTRRIVGTTPPARYRLGQQTAGVHNVPFGKPDRHQLRI